MKNRTKFVLTILATTIISACGSSNNKASDDKLTGNYTGATVKSDKTLVSRENVIASTSDKYILVDGKKITFADLEYLEDKESNKRGIGKQTENHTIIIPDYNTQYSSIGTLMDTISTAKSEDIDDDKIVDDTIFIYYFAYGKQTPVTKIPTSGIANYTGHFISVREDFTKSSATYQVDFANKKLTGQLQQYKFNWDNGYIDTKGDVIDIDADIQENTFSGTAKFRTENKLTGDVKGSFYGPNAEELAGTINGRKDERDIARGWNAAFIGKKE